MVVALSLFSILQANTGVVHRPVIKDVLSLMLSFMIIKRVQHIKISKMSRVNQMDLFSNAQLFQAQLKTNT